MTMKLPAGIGLVAFTSNLSPQPMLSVPAITVRCPSAGCTCGGMWYPSGILRRYVNGTLATVRSPSRVAHLGPRGIAAEQSSHLSSSALTKMVDLATAAAGFVGSWRSDPGNVSSRAGYHGPVVGSVHTDGVSSRTRVRPNESRLSCGALKRFIA